MCLAWDLLLLKTGLYSGDLIGYWPGQWRRCFKITLLPSCSKEQPSPSPVTTWPKLHRLFLKRGRIRDVPASWKIHQVSGTLRLPGMSPWERWGRCVSSLPHSVSGLLNKSSTAYEKSKLPSGHESHLHQIHGTGPAHYLFFSSTASIITETCWGDLWSGYSAQVP